MSSMNESDLFYEKALEFFEDVKRSIETNHQLLADRQRAETESLWQQHQQLLADVEATHTRQRATIDELVKQNRLRQQQVEQLYTHVNTLQEQLQKLVAAMEAQSAASAIQPPAVTSAINATTAPCAEVGSSSTQPRTTKKPKSTTATKSVAQAADTIEAITPAELPVDAPIAAAQVEQVVDVPAVIATETDPVEPLSEHRATPAVEAPSLSVRESNAFVVQHFLELEGVSQIMSELKSLPKTNANLKRHLGAIAKLSTFSTDIACAPEAFAFALNVWFLTLLLKEKQSYYNEMKSMYENFNETRKKIFEYPDNEKLHLKLKNSALMSEALRTVYKNHGHTFIREHEQNIRAVTIALESYCQQRSDIKDSQAWVAFLSKWLNESPTAPSTPAKQ